MNGDVGGKMRKRAASALAETERTSSDSEEDHLAVVKASKDKYKPTYYARKDEIAALEEEYKALTKQLEQIEIDRRAGRHLGNPLYKNLVLRERLGEADAAVDDIQLAISSKLAEEAHNPLSTFIHLKADPATRLQTLHSLRRRKLQDALRFILERTRALDLRRPHRRTETFDTANGDHIVIQCDVTPFSRESSVKHVYDEVLRALLHQDFSVWENLGISTWSDTENLLESVVSQVRFLSTMSTGVEVEKNLTTFLDFAASGSEDLKMPYGLLVQDAVDIDDVYPYNSKQRVRHDLTLVMLVCPSPPVEGSTQPGVSLLRWSYVKLHRPECPVTPSEEDDLVDMFSRWCEVLRKVLLEYVESRRTLQTSLSLEQNVTL
ncbi:hypothetical protein Poli38472_012367 [Pythium oligandrum]|uniref:Uncharacterized protein n=1 Tax=Pythium oligandrum TaxID=41045 RepID=A0A8K1CP68_PYTOL|nr:hypothetical protein Poli38472_012367 [Pythium oligandrum]|eukprot:TMW67251.1 hypothetical protein Poli38472_012367 [Pythium oligandrum]